MIVSTQLNQGGLKNNKLLNREFLFLDARHTNPNPTPTMHTLSCATVALFASFAAAKAEAPTDRSLPFADIADPAARAAFEAMAREIGGLKTSVKDLSGELDAQKTHSAAVEARLGKAEAALGQESPESYASGDKGTRRRGCCRCGGTS